MARPLALSAEGGPETQPVGLGNVSRVKNRANGLVIYLAQPEGLGNVSSGKSLLSVCHWRVKDKPAALAEKLNRVFVNHSSDRELRVTSATHF